MRLPIAILPVLATCAAAADYVGNQACARCHQAIYQSFLRTPMAQSSGRTGAADILQEPFERAEYRDSRGAFLYRIGKDNGRYYFDFVEQGKTTPVQGRRSLPYFVGSGTAARGYLLNVDGFLYEAPVTYYGRSGAWNAAPGFAQNDYPYLTRPVLPGCLQCHASRVQPIAGTQNAYADPPFLDGGVACERCHGPGSDHASSGKPLVNPAKLAPAERDSICAQCHLSGEIRVPRAGKTESSFVAGARLADVVTVFARSGSGAEMRVTSHVENLAQSACKRASGDKLWCGSCHDLHSVPPPSQKAAYFRRKCLACHQTSDCRAPQTARQANGDDCAGCHMPHNPPSDVDHVVFTDHSIRRRPTLSAASPKLDADLVPFGGGNPGPRDLGLAYAMVALREQNAAYRERATTLLQQAVNAGSADAQALAYLAEFYRDGKDDAHALPLYEQAWRLDRSQYAAAAALGAYQMQRGNLPEAIRFWNQALEISPALVLVRTNLATALIRVGRTEEARAVLQKALEFNPAFQPAKELLNRLSK